MGGFLTTQDHGDVLTWVLPRAMFGSVALLPCGSWLLLPPKAKKIGLLRVGPTPTRKNWP